MSYIPFNIFCLPELQSILEQNNLPLNVRNDKVGQILYSRRYPILSDLEIRLAKAIDQLKLDDKTRVLIQDSFESNEIRIEMKFHTRDQFIIQLEKLVRASDSNALDELIHLFKNP